MVPYEPGVSAVSVRARSVSRLGSSPSKEKWMGHSGQGRRQA